MPPTPQNLFSWQRFVVRPTEAPCAADVPAKGPDFINLQNSDMLSSNVVGLDIYNQQNNDIGKIQDVAFDSSKKITGYILSVGGFLGMGNPLCRGRSRRGGDQVRRRQQGLARDHQRDQGSAEVGARIQVRGSVDRQQKLTGIRDGTGNSPFHPSACHPSACDKEQRARTFL